MFLESSILKTRALATCLLFVALDLCFFDVGRGYGIDVGLSMKDTVM